MKFTPAGGPFTCASRARGIQRNSLSPTQCKAFPGSSVGVRAVPSGDGSTTRVHSGWGSPLDREEPRRSAGGAVTATAPGQAARTFTVRLPIALGAEARASVVADARQEIASIHGVSVLVVDDDEQSRDVVAAHLQGWNAAVLTASSAEQALEMLKSQHVDVLLADIGMPGEDGYALIEKIRRSEAAGVASVPAAALTAFAREEDRQRALQAGFQLHLAKPVEPLSLVAAVANLRTRNAAPA